MNKRFCLGVCLGAVAVLAGGSQGAVLVDHPPLNSGGPSSDTDYSTLFGEPYWQLLADDFQLSTNQQIGRVRWWGFYGNNFSNDSVQPPTGDETIRVRFYDSDGENGLPGTILSEQSLLNPLRVATGRFVLTTRMHPEFVYESNLSIPFTAAAGARYWLEVVQVGIPDSVFRWEVSSAPSDVHAGMNPDTLGWIYSTPVNANLAFQLNDVPEPSAVLMVLAGAILLRRRKGGGR